MQPKHTPTQVYIERNGYKTEIKTDKTLSQVIAAVNMHDDLITLLEECYSTINQLGFLSRDGLYKINLDKVEQALKSAGEI